MATAQTPPNSALDDAPPRSARHLNPPAFISSTFSAVQRLRDKGFALVPISRSGSSSVNPNSPASIPARRLLDRWRLVLALILVGAAAVRLWLLARGLPTLDS